MDLLTLSQLPLSPDHGWPLLSRRRPAYARVFALLVLPLSLLPPAMLLYAGTHHPAMFTPELAHRDWLATAAVFFAAEMLTLLAMGALVKALADSHGLVLGWSGAYLLASVAPVPMWLSSLALFVPSLVFNGVAALTGLGLACALMVNGIQGLCRTREGVTAAGMAQIVIGAGILGWGLLLTVALA